MHFKHDNYLWPSQRLNHPLRLKIKTDNNYNIKKKTEEKKLIQK